MFSSALTCIVLLSGALSAAGNVQPDAGRVYWTDLPALPVAASGAFAGEHHGVLFLAGGAMWPESPFQGGRKVWLANAYVLEPGADEWRKVAAFDHAAAYGVAVSTTDGIICAGGSDGVTHSRTVLRVAWDGNASVRERLPELPTPCAYMGGSVLGDILYLAGGQATPESTEAMHTFWALDLADDSANWQALEPWPGSGRILPVVAAQDGALFVFSGVSLSEGEGGAARRQYLEDGYQFRPGEGWTAVTGPPLPIAAAPALAFGQAHVMVFSGDDGTLAERIPELGDDHPGFSKSVLGYHTVTDTWAELGVIPESYVTTTAIPWEDGFVIPGGEDRPGHRGRRVLFGRFSERAEGLGPLDHAMIVLYFAALVAMGMYFSRREKSTDDFFVGGRRIPWWAAGISIFGTLLSAITFLTVPATAFAQNWMYFMGNVAGVAVAPVVVCFYLPFFRRLSVASAYEYLERRFNVGARLFGAAAFVLFQLGRVGIVLLLPALALSAATGIDKYTAIVAMGVLCTLYTVLGGIEAVIWTDVLQVVILFGGALLALVLATFDIDGGTGSILTTAWADGKFHMFNWTWDCTVAAVWVVLIGRTLETMIPYTTDQTVVQRYLTTPSRKDAAKAIWGAALFSVPSGALFFGIGTALYVFYKGHPELLDPALKADAILPLFIVQRFPAGLAGIVIAAVFAAAMSSLDSSLNSVAAVVVSDFYGRFRPRRSERASLLLARALCAIVGAAGTGMALFMASRDIPSLWELYMQIIGLFGGGLAGLFALGIFTRRANGFGALVGAVGGAVILFFVRRHTQISFLLYSSIGIASSFVIGYAVSLLTGGAGKNLAGLTWSTRDAE